MEDNARKEKATIYPPPEFELPSLGRKLKPYEVLIISDGRTPLEIRLRQLRKSRLKILVGTPDVR